MVKTCVICGLGGHARGSWVNSIKKHSDYKLIGIVDTNTELLSNVPNMGLGLSEEQTFMKIQEVVQYGQKPDVAIIATPISTHHVIAKDALDLGINVICEKNMATSLYQGRQMVQAALDHPELCTAMGTQRRYMLQYWTAKKYLQSAENQIGKLNMIRWTDAFNWGQYREGWRQYLEDLFAEDQMIHWFDLMRNITGMDIVQVKADSFIVNGSSFQGASTILVNLAFAKPDDYNHRHNWVWAQFYGDWQRKGPAIELAEFSGTKGRFNITPNWGLELFLYSDALGNKWEEDGVLPDQNVENLGTKYESQCIILEMMKRGIESKGKVQPKNNFKDVFKSFAATMACKESSRTGKAVWVPDSWKDLPI